METETMTMTDFLKDQDIRMQAIELPHRPDELNDKWGGSASHFVLALINRGPYGQENRKPRCMVCYWSQGSAHKGAPKLADVLDSLRSDAESAESNRTFDDFLSEFGYEINSAEDYQQARATYRACKKVARDLRNLLGEADYRTLLDKVERL